MGASLPPLSAQAIAAAGGALASTVATKADSSTVSALATTVAGKADSSTVSALATTVASKADSSTVSALATTVGTKADASALTALAADAADGDALTAAGVAKAGGALANRAYDVIVVGATEAGVMAAVKAARMGARTLLTSDSGWIGWMTGQGITLQDIQPKRTPAVLWGLTREFHEKVARNWPLKYIQFWWRNNGASYPRWYQRAWQEITAEPNLTVVLNAKIVTVTTAAQRITSVTFDTGIDRTSGTYTAQTWVDGTPTGDLLRLAGCSYTIGRESSAAYGESGAGVLAHAAMPGGNAVDPYVTPGNSGSGLIFGVDSAPADTVGTGDGRVMLSGYRLFFASGADKIAFPAPTNYNPANYELLGRMFAANAAYYTDITKILQFYDISGVGAAAGPTYLTHADINSGGPFSTNYPVQSVCKEYITASYTRRAEIEQLFKDHALGLIYWILNSNDSRIPSAIKTQLSAYGLSANEWQATGGLAPQVYTREPARLVNDNVFRGTQATGGQGIDNPVGMLHYGFDSHYVRVFNNAGSVRSEGAILNELPNTVYASRVPMSVMVPRASECKNLVVAYGVAVSRYVWSSLRVAPSIMQVGESAGAMAAISGLRKIDTQSVTYTMLSEYLDLYGTKNCISVDVTDTGKPGVVTLFGTWTSTQAVSVQPYPKLGYLRSSGAGATERSRVQPFITNSGMYRVIFRYVPDDTVANGGQGRATNATVRIVTGSSAQRSATVTVTAANPAVFTITAHGLAIGDRVRLSTTGALLTGLTAGTTYYVVSVPTADTFTLSASPGGSAIATSGTQSGTHTATMVAVTTVTRTVNQLYNQSGDFEDGRADLGVFYFSRGRPSLDYVELDCTGADDIVTESGVDFFFQPAFQPT